MAELDNGWERWRGDVTATLRALEEGQARIEESLKDRDQRHSGRIGKVEKDVAGAYVRIEGVERRYLGSIVAGLGAVLLAVLAWVLDHVR